MPDLKTAATLTVDDVRAAVASYSHWDLEGRLSTIEVGFSVRRPFALSLPQYVNPSEDPGCFRVGGENHTLETLIASVISGWVAEIQHETQAKKDAEATYDQDGAMEFRKIQQLLRTKIGRHSQSRRRRLLKNLSGLLEKLEAAEEVWRREYNQVRPHSSLGYKPPAPGPLISNRILTLDVDT